MAKSLKEQEIIFITGKGGVGKSAVAAAMALKKSQQGKKTLLVELGSQSFFKDYFHLSEVNFKPINLKPNLDLALWSGTECLREYARYLLKVESLYRLFFENSVTRSLINVAPGLSELAIMGKATSYPRQVGPPLEYDCIVIDSFATGHFIALLKAPQGMAQAINFGPMGEQSRSITRVLEDAKICRYFVVSIPEELPVQEAQELSKSIQELTHIKPSQILNKYLNISPEALTSSASNANVHQYKEQLQNSLQRQAQLLLTLKTQSQQEPLKLPFVFSADPWQVVADLAAGIP